PAFGARGGNIHAFDFAADCGGDRAGGGDVGEQDAGADSADFGGGAGGDAGGGLVFENFSHGGRGFGGGGVVAWVFAGGWAWAGEGRAREWRAGARVGLRFAAVLIPMLTAQILAWREFEEAMRELGY